MKRREFLSGAAAGLVLGAVCAGIGSAGAEDLVAKFDSRMAAKFAADHAYVRALVERLRKEGMTNLRYLPSAPMNTGDGDSTVDTCHLNDYGMKQAAKAFGAAIREILAK